MTLKRKAHENNYERVIWEKDRVIAGAPPVLFSGSRFLIFADPTISETGIGYYSLGRPNLQWNSVSFQLNCLFIASGLGVQGCNPAP